MKKYVILFNPFADNNNGEAGARKLDEILKGNELTYVDMSKIQDYGAFYGSISGDQSVVICGGDGTLNWYINEVDSNKIKGDVYYFATGSGNDFLRDLDGASADKLVRINEYVKNLPTVTVNGKDYKFINNVGFGIDGYCCEVGDKLRAQGEKDKINYTSIAIKGLLFGFKRVKATITVDGVEYKFKNVWLAPTMNGRFYGGGMMIAPNQNRLENQTLSVVVFRHWSKLKTLIVFPSIFKGEHVKRKKMTYVLTGKNIKVEFDKPTALQIDGETVLGVTSYEAKADITNR